MGGSGGALAELWEAPAELREALGELWEGLYIYKNYRSTAPADVMLIQCQHFKFSDLHVFVSVHCKKNTTSHISRNQVFKC